MLRKFMITALAVAGIAAATPAMAAGGDTWMAPDRNWSFDGVFGHYDNAQLRRGLQIYREVCSSCHGLSQIRFRELLDIGVPEEEAREYAEQFEVQDGFDEYGDPAVRPGSLADRIPSPFPNEAAARFANAGALPPDLSLMAKARVGGAHYVYSLMLGYQQEQPADLEVMEGMYYNPAFSGDQIAMPQMLWDDSTGFDDGSPTDLASLSADLASFLMWTAEPALEQRKSMGVKVMLFLIVMTGLFYALKRQVWARVKH